MPARTLGPSVKFLLPLTSVVFEILVTLASGDHHGYSILIDVRERTGERLRAGSLYRAIGRLLDDALVDLGEDHAFAPEVMDGECSA